MASAAVALSVSVRWISVFLLLIFIQMLTSQMLFAGVFILSDETLISPFLFCVTREDGELSCGERYRSPEDGAESELKINILTPLVVLCLYVPVVLVAFALLTALLASYAKDRAALRFSMACQAASSLLILTGLAAFLLLNESYARLEHMTLGFYTCVGVQVQLGFVAVLTHLAGTRLTSDWDQTGPNKKLSCTWWRKGNLNCEAKSINEGLITLDFLLTVRLILLHVLCYVLKTQRQIFA